LISNQGRHGASSACIVDPKAIAPVRAMARLGSARMRFARVHRIDRETDAR
jgi:hypothetical protein